MRRMRIALAAAFALSLTVHARAQNPAPPAVAGPPPVPTSVWASKPTALPRYPAGVRPWIKVADVKAAHRGEANWRERLFDDGRLSAEYVAAAPGTMQSPRFHPDTREWFAVVEGEVRVEIEGQAPIVATRGSVVNIPRHTVFSVTTAGNTPSLRFVLNVAGAKTSSSPTPPRRRRRPRPQARRGCARLSIGPQAATTSSTLRTSTSTPRGRRTRSTPAAGSSATTSPRCW